MVLVKKRKDLSSPLAYIRLHHPAGSLEPDKQKGKKGICFLFSPAIKARPPYVLKFDKA
jgi:hypothetical protein